MGAEFHTDERAVLIVGRLRAVPQKGAADVIGRTCKLAAIIVAVPEGLGMGQMCRNPCLEKQGTDPAQRGPSAKRPKAILRGGKVGQVDRDPLRHRDGAQPFCAALFEGVEDDQPFLGIDAIPAQRQRLGKAATGYVEELTEQTEVFRGFARCCEHLALHFLGKALAVQVQLGAELRR
ncbi:hypothetical protein JANAI62_37560 [Jannaschia pagri]|uniref:Uncharacterized protein n=1 Tax=Jannaschia pagri TaxID=2829797 RepID=A0ABQ4NRV7_9RHOB|nr:hypothetical protein JANAI61_37950 [Jannaschia sp. AI_61]GIT97133.1 hypothetical protein JANAI62_37560 [Jannaschia sp. AI_62]